MFDLCGRWSWDYSFVVMVVPVFVPQCSFREWRGHFKFVPTSPHLPPPPETVVLFIIKITS